MSEQTQSNNQQTIVIALVVIAVLLAALVGILIYQQSNKPAATAAVDTTAQTQQGAVQAPAGMGQAAAGSTTPFDPKTATKVSGSDITAFVKAYNEAVVKGDYATAYKMLPVDKQKSYGDANSYGSQLKGYGITGYKLGKLSESGDTASIVAVQENPSMPIAYTWNFKKVNGTWYVESRVMGGTIQ